MPTEIAARIFGHCDFVNLGAVNLLTMQNCDDSHKCARFPLFKSQVKIGKL